MSPVRMRYGIFNGSNELLGILTKADCPHCIYRLAGDKTGVCKFDGKPVRVLWRKISNNTQIVVCCSNEKGAKSGNKRAIRQNALYFEAFARDVFPKIAEQSAKNAAEEVEDKAKTIRSLIHNLRTYNAKSRQALELAFPEDMIIRASDKLALVRHRLFEQTDTVVDAIVKTTQNIALSAAEFRVWDFIDAPSAIVRSSNHKVHAIFRLVAYTFWNDFRRSRIELNLGASHEKIRIHFDSFSAALTHLLGNAAKYAKPTSRISVRFDSHEGFVNIELRMTSLYIHPEEREVIKTRGARGRETDGIPGTGQGLGIISQLLEFSEAALETKWGGQPTRWNGKNFAENVFVVSVPRA